MLTYLSIENIAIIDSLTLTFQKGLTVITGETGAGKSILLDAIALALGNKVSAKDILRTGADRGRIELGFQIPVKMPANADEIEDESSLRGVLIREGIVESLPDPLQGETGEIIISREFSQTGSRCRINGVLVPRETVESLRTCMIDLHGQHELTLLFDKTQQRVILDSLGDENYRLLKQQMKEIHHQWRATKEHLSFIRNQLAQQAKQRELLLFQSQELMEAQLSHPNEDETCRQTLDKLMYSEKLREAAAGAYQILRGESSGYEQSSISDSLFRVQKLLTDPARMDDQLNEVHGRIVSLAEEVKDIASELSHYQEKIDYQPDASQDIMQRLDVLEKLKRKYGPTLQNVFQTQEKIDAELEAESRLEYDADALEATFQDWDKKLHQTADMLTVQRQQLADRFIEAMISEFPSLALPSAQFDIQFHSAPISAEGQEEVEFLFSANPGEPLRGLAKVASGGELSRFFLALKVLTAQQGDVQTIIFDEIDTGISGLTAKSVAQKLWRLSHQLQVLVITHQPIVASVGDAHFHVVKHIESESRVRVTVEMMEEKEKRLMVLSRIASGIDTDDEVVGKYVQRLLQEADQFKVMGNLH